MEFNFFLNPLRFLHKNNTLKSKSKDLFKVFLFLLGFIMLSQFVLQLINTFFEHFYDYDILDTIQGKKVEKLLHKKNTLLKLCALILIAPITEEIIFRLPLKIKKNNVIIAFTLYYFIHVGGSIYKFNIENSETLIKFGTVIGIILFGNLFLKESYLKMPQKYATLYFYALAIFFTYEHIGFYLKTLPTNLLILTPYISNAAIFISIGNILLKTEKWNYMGYYASHAFQYSYINKNINEFITTQETDYIIRFIQVLFDAYNIRPLQNG